jgi:hypothetical protein
MGCAIRSRFSNKAGDGVRVVGVERRLVMHGQQGGHHFPTLPGTVVMLRQVPCHA